MPIVSRAQQKAMYAAKAGKSTLGIPQSVGEKFVETGPKGGSFGKLPQRIKPAAASTRDYAKGGHVVGSAHMHPILAIAIHRRPR